MNVEEAIYGCMCSILRRGGITLTFDQMEAVKVDCEGLSKALKTLAQDEAREMVKKLQTATLTAFNKVTNDLDNMEKTIIELDERTLHLVPKELSLEERIAKNPPVARPAYPGE